MEVDLRSTHEKLPRLQSVGLFNPNFAAKKHD